MEKFIKSFGLPIAILLGLYLPIGYDMSSLILPILMLLLFISFLKINMNDFKLEKLILLKSLLVILFMGFSVYYISSFLGFDDIWITGMVLTALTPTALSSPIIVNYLKGDVSLNTQVILLLNLASIVYIPIFFRLMFSQSVSIDLLMFSQKLLFTLLVPLFVAVIMRKFKKGNEVLKHFDKAGFLLLCFAVFIVVSKNADYILSNLSVNIFYGLIVFLLACSNYCIGYFIGGSGVRALTTSVSIGHKNTLLAIWIAVSFMNPLIAVAPTLYLLSHHVINSFLFLRMR